LWNGAKNQAGDAGRRCEDAAMLTAVATFSVAATLIVLLPGPARWS
jgi:hypothetical protein